MPPLNEQACPDDEGVVTAVLRNPTTGPTPIRHYTEWPRVRDYDVLSLIGAGGMGVVYKARHRDLRRTVALKTIRATVAADPEFLVRFYAEAEAVARLQHPNIIQVFEIGTVESDAGECFPSPFIALEFVDGGSLDEAMTKPHLPLDAARMVEKLARAAHAAHRVGVIHRDLKPANVLLTRDGEPKIADFGVAKQLRADRDEAQGRPSLDFQQTERFVTLAGAVMGTPAYMAPEQASSAPATAAVDIYALGVILYQMLTARLPFRAASALGTMDLVRNQEPISPRCWQPRLPRDLETICLKCLEKDPARRYLSAEALADDLRRFLDHRPILARRVGPVEKVGRWCRRNPLPAALMPMVAAIFLSAFALVSLSYVRSEQARQELAHQRNEAERREEAERWERYRANIVASANALQVHNAGGARATLDAAPLAHRNWEWRHFGSQLDRAQHVLTGFAPDTVSACELSADGSRVALMNGASVCVWDTARAQQILVFTSSTFIAHVRLSPDGRTLAYRANDTEVVLRDVDTNQVRAVLQGHERTVHAIFFTASGNRLVTASHDQPIRIWDVATGELAQCLPSERHEHYHISINGDGSRMTRGEQHAAAVPVFDPDTGRVLASVPTMYPRVKLQGIDLDERGDRVVITETYPTSVIHLWDVVNGRHICAMKGHKNAVLRHAFSPDGTRFASASRDQTVRLWDARTGDCLATLTGHKGAVSHVVFSPDGTRLVSASEDHTVRLWDGQTGEALAVLLGHTGEVFHAGFAANGRTIVSGSRDGTVRLWDRQTIERNNVLRGHNTFVYSVAFHPDGEQLASASWDGTVRLWHATTGQVTATLDHGDGTFVSSVAFHPTGTMLASRSRDAVRLWDTASGQLLHCWNIPGSGWMDTRVAFNARGDRVAAGCKDCEVRIWDVQTHDVVSVLHCESADIRDVTFSPDGRLLVSVGDLVVRVWDVAEGKQVQALTGHTSGGYAAAFNHKGTLLATGARDGTVRLWDTATWQEVAVLPHGVNVYGVAFSPDGTRLACACADNSIRFWDVGTHQEVADLRGHDAYVHQVAFSPDGTRLASASGDHTLRIWDTLSAQARPARDR